jgi:hypothetical protein
MYKATRELIKARQPHAKYVLEQVFVRNVGGGAANQCFQNATNDELVKKGNKIVSGWLVSTFDINKKSTAIIQHWWNVDGDGNYFDTTPGVDPTVEYVIDTSIVEYGQNNYDNLDNLVALSLLFKDGDFYTVDKKNGKLTTKYILNLATENLFQFS